MRTVGPASGPVSGLEAFRELERFLSEAGEARLGLSLLERGAEHRGRELLRLSLQAHLDARGDGDVGEALLLASPDGEVCLTHKRAHARSLVTIFGAVKLTRIGYGARGRPSIHPLDRELGLPQRSFSYELQRRLCKGAVLGPFEEALELIADLTGVNIPKRSAQQIVLESAVDFDAFYAERARHDSKPARGEILVAAVDCKGIPMVKVEGAMKLVRRGKGQKANKKRMATVAAVHSQTPQARTPEDVLDSLFCTERPAPRSQQRPRPNHKRVWASLLADKDTFIRDVKAEMQRRDPRHRRTWVIVTDGERALQRRVTDSFTDVTLILDLLHVLEKLWLCAHALHREGSPEAQAFVYERARRILEGNVSQVIKGLRLIVTKRNLTGNKAKSLRDVAAYYQRNRQRMRYDTYLANGWPIASGSVEGACKNLIRDRFERSGMRWTPPMAEAMLKLRAIYLSGDFDNYWEFHVQQEQQRLYPDGQWRVVAK
jgi:hypothetical protein